MNVSIALSTPCAYQWGSEMGPPTDKVGVNAKLGIFFDMLLNISFKF